MFGIEEKVERVRQALIAAMTRKSAKIMAAHAAKAPADIPKHDLARAMVLQDLAEILTNLDVNQG